MWKVGEKEGSSEMHWSGKVHGRPFQGSKPAQCAQALSGALRARQKDTLWSFLLQLPSNHLTMFLWGTHLSLTFNSPAL